MIYTGAVDEYYIINMVSWPIVVLNFVFETYDKQLYQEAPVVNYPNDYDYTRITEYKQLTGQEHNKTTISKEFPCSEGEPYYPFPTAEHRKQYEMYAADMTKENNVIFIGRLAEYRYYNMDGVVRRALDMFTQLQKR